MHKLYAIAFSARLNGLQVDQVDRENDKRTSTYHRCGNGGGRGDEGPLPPENLDRGTSPPEKGSLEQNA